jgi:hypothetical protein
MQILTPIMFLSLRVACSAQGEEFSSARMFASAPKNLSFSSLRFFRIVL